MHLATRPLRRSRQDETIAGVLGGIAEYFGLNSGRLRLAYVIATIFSGGVGIVWYLMLWYVIPESDSAF